MINSIQYLLTLLSGIGMVLAIQFILKIFRKLDLKGTDIGTYTEELEMMIHGNIDGFPERVQSFEDWKKNREALKSNPK